MQLAFVNEFEPRGENMDLAVLALIGMYEMGASPTGGGLVKTPKALIQRQFRA